MDKVAVVIVGAGAVGLAIARYLSRSGSRFQGSDIVLLERHDAFGRETSSRNSEVIHAGFYYPPGSLKAKLCVPGNRLMYEFCAANAVPHKRIGKLVVARDDREEEKIGELFDQGRACGVPGLELVNREKLRELEPAITGCNALFSPSTGIFDSHTFMKTMERQSIANGVTVAYHCAVCGISRTPQGYVVTVADADRSETTLCADRVINAAGLSADTVASLAGIDIDGAGYRLRYCKGEYFAVASRHRGKMTHLVYPAPTAISLGIHGVLGLDGSIRLGPNAFYTDSIDYTVDESHAREFYENAKSLFPFLESKDLSPDMAGIRPKLQKPGEKFRDFVIRDEADKGLPGFINLVGIESPGLTSALAIGEYVEKLLAD